MFHVEIFRLADQPGIDGGGGSDEIGAECQNGFSVEVCGKPFHRQFHAIALDTREANFECIAFGAHGLDLHCLARRLGWGDDRLGGEIEGDAENVRVFDVEQTLIIQLVGLAA